MTLDKLLPCASVSSTVKTGDITVLANHRFVAAMSRSNEFIQIKLSHKVLKKYCLCLCPQDR